MGKEQAVEKLVDILHWKEYTFIGQDGAVFEGCLTQASEEHIAAQLLKAGYQLPSTANEVDEVAIGHKVLAVFKSISDQILEHNRYDGVKALRDILDLIIVTPKPSANREAVIKIFGCSDCVALEECLTDKPMNFCTDKRDWLRQILSLIEPKVLSDEELEKRRQERNSLDVSTAYSRGRQNGLTILDANIASIKQEIEGMSHQMNTNMYGISIGRPEWENYWKQKVSQATVDKNKEAIK